MPAASKKRAACSGDDPSKRKRQSKTPVDHFRLLDLPPELRDQIYDYAIADKTAVLRPVVRGRLISKLALLCTSRQVRDEVQAVLYLRAPIVAYVKDLDFSHVVSFLNKLSDCEINVLPYVNVPSERTFLFKIKFTDHCAPNPEALHRWLLRCEHPTKKGTSIRTSYIFDTNVGRPCFPGCNKCRIWDPDPRPRERLPHEGSVVWGVLKAQEKTVEKFRDAGEKGRAFDELRKIVRALCRPDIVVQ